MIKLNVGDVVKFDSAAKRNRVCTVKSFHTGKNALNETIDWVVLEWPQRAPNGKMFMATVRLAYLDQNMKMMNVRKVA